MNYLLRQEFKTLQRSAVMGASLYVSPELRRHSSDCESVS